MKFSFHILSQKYINLQIFTLQTAKEKMTKEGGSIPFLQRMALAGFSGAVGGFVGTPGDLINVRMQNDIKLPQEQRRK